MRDALGVGALNLDLIYQVDSLEMAGMKFRPGGEVVADGTRFQAVLQELRAKGRLLGRSGGGSAANAISAMARMGIGTGFIGTVGKDEEGGFPPSADGGHGPGRGAQGRDVGTMHLPAGRQRPLADHPA